MFTVNIGRMILMAIFGNKDNTGSIICFGMSFGYLMMCTVMSAVFGKKFQNFMANKPEKEQGYSVL